VIGHVGEPGGDPVAVLVVVGADRLDQRRRVRPDVGPPGTRRGGGRGHRRRLDGEDLRHVTLKQGAERTSRAADVQREDLLQVEEPLGLR
jgi:hypothetical protein